MRLGIKTGLKGDYKSEIIQAKPEFVEIWYNSGKAADYQDLFRFLTQQKVPFGLHFWGALPDITLANIAYPDSYINQKSYQLYQQTVEIAAKHKCLYVNLHPHGYRLTKVDFSAEKFAPYTKAADKKTCLDNLHKHLTQLSEFGKNVGVPIFIEAAPKYANGTPWTGSTGRLHPVDIGEIPVTDISGIFEIPNLFFANDFGHIGSVMVNKTRQQIIDFIMLTTQKYLAQTRLLHIGYLLPPFLGTDYHGSLKYPEFATDLAVPNKSETQQLLQLFKDNDDVLALVEPESDHVGNFQELKKLLQQL